MRHGPMLSFNAWLRSPWESFLERMAEYLDNRDEVHRIKTPTPAQQWPPPPPNPANPPEDPPMFPDNQLFYTALHSLSSLRPRSPTHSAFDPKFVVPSRTTDRRLPPSCQPEPAPQRGSQLPALLAGGRPASRNRVVGD